MRHKVLGGFDSDGSRAFDCVLMASCLLDSVVEHGLDWSRLTWRGRHQKNERVQRRRGNLREGIPGKIPLVCT